MAEPSDLLNKFRKCVQEIEEMIGRLQDLARLVRSGEIPKEAAEPLKDEYMRGLLGHAERFFTLEDGLEAERARIRLELERHRSSKKTRALEARIGQIEDAFKSVNLQVELMTVKYYLMFLSSAMKRGEMTKEEFDKQRDVYRHFLDSVAERWAYQKNELNKGISGLEPQLESITSDLKELWVRHTVGEIPQAEYNSARTRLEEKLKSVESSIEKYRRYIDAVDARVFECYLLYTQPNPEVSFDFESITPPEELPKITDLEGKVKVGDELLTPQELYDRTLYQYSLIWGMGSASTKSNLEKDIRKLMEKGMTREQALVYLNESVRGKR
ncbi:MAG: CdvA-like protein [Candidatus Brockarchaeota archaeon]|nr:CdvA-like protein [Candidatus Brockarchaeota archaeon]